MLRISKRLEMIAGGVPTGSRLADIGSDHALLPVYLAQKKQIVKAVAGEVNLGPFQAASRQVRDSVLDQVIDVRHGNGLEVVEVGEIDVITIAGMGGALIADILEAARISWPVYNYLFYSPMLVNPMCVCGLFSRIGY